MFAPKFHPAMATVVRPRKELGIRTIFNVLGPMTNPAGAVRQLMGVYDEKLTEKLAEVLLKLGTERAFIVHGKDGTDEITISDATKITEIRDGEIKSYTVTPEDFGLLRAPFSEIKGGETLEENREIVRRVLTGDEKGAKRDVVALNAGFALVAGGRVEKVEEGIEMAVKAMEEGKPYELLCRLVKLTNELYQIVFLKNRGRSKDVRLFQEEERFRGGAPGEPEPAGEVAEAGRGKRKESSRGRCQRPHIQ